MLYKDFIILTCNAYFLSIVIIVFAHHTCLSSIISMIRNTDYVILFILVKTYI